MSIRKRSPLYNSLVAFLTLSLLITPVFDTASALNAMPQDKCAAELAEAENKYQLGQLDEAIQLVRSCLDKDELGLEESEKAYKLLGKAYHAKGLLEQGKENIRKLLQLIPSWRPDPDIETPSFLRFAEEVIKEMEQEKPTKPVVEEAQVEEQVEPAQPQEEPVTKSAQPPKKGSKALLWIGIGAAAIGGGLLAVMAGGGGNGEPPTNGPPNGSLPEPPGAPGSN